jgi:hypothetical protein
MVSAALTTVFLAGCAGSSDLPPLAEDHPANPAAAEAPPSRYSDTLTAAAVPPVTAPSATQPAGQDHGGHHEHH